MSYDDRNLPRRAVLAVLAGAAGLVLALGAPVIASAAASTAFGYTDDGTNYVVGTGAGLVFKVDHTNGDLSSFVYGGTEYQGYDGKNSHIESGLGASTVTISTPAAGVVLITVVHGTLIHYYAARSGENNIYLFTYKADTSVAASRYIARLKPGIFPTTYPDTWSDSDTVIESADVFAKADGTTRSKHFANLRTIDYEYFGFTTPASTAAVWVVRSTKEKDSGGPFACQPARQVPPLPRALTVAPCTPSILQEPAMGALPPLEDPHANFRHLKTQGSGRRPPRRRAGGDRPADDLRPRPRRRR